MHDGPAARTRAGPQDQPPAIGPLIAGIIGLVITVLAPLLVPIALAMGMRAKQRIAAGGGALEGQEIAPARYVLGVIGTAITGLFVLAFGPA